MARKDDFHEYSAGSTDGLTLKGWYKDKHGNVTAWVDIKDRTYIRIDTPDMTPECMLATRNAAWNAVRDSARAIDDLAPEPEKTDYWPQSTVSCLVSLAMKELHRTPKGESRDAKDRRRRTLRTLEDVFASSETFLPEKRDDDWREEDENVLWFAETENRETAAESPLDRQSFKR